MKNIPTAEEFMNDIKNIAYSQEEMMIEFAKQHVEAALKAAAENAEITNKAKFPGDYNPVVDEDSILNAYPLENIK